MMDASPQVPTVSILSYETTLRERIKKLFQNFLEPTSAGLPSSAPAFTRGKPNRENLHIAGFSRLFLLGFSQRTSAFTSFETATEFTLV
jgi:hypothetical protein